MNCPFCSSKKVAVLEKGPRAMYRCCGCEALFDDEPDEGGDYSSKDPSRRMEREEAAEARRRAKQQREHPARRLFQ